MINKKTGLKCLSNYSAGDSYRSLRQQYRIGYSTVGKIIREVCVEIFDLLKDIYLVVSMNIPQYEYPSVMGHNLGVNDVELENLLI